MQGNVDQANPPMDRLILPEKIWRQLTEHAVRDLPNECLGMLAGLPDGRVCAAYEIVNASTNPHRFLSDPASLCAAEKRRRSAGWHLLGFYHSHPHGRPIPSSIDTDPEVNFWLDGSTATVILAVRSLNQFPAIAQALLTDPVATTESLTTSDSVTGILRGYYVEARAYRLFPHRWQLIPLSLGAD